MKSRQELIDHQEQLIKMHKEVEQELITIPGVVGIGVGIKETRGQLTEEIAFRVYVEKKKDKKDLPPEYIIPDEIKGIKVDVLTKSLFEPACSEGRIRPLVGGIQISKVSDIELVPGTLGCMATLNDDSGTSVLLSNAHVLYAGVSFDGENVWQPQRKTFLGFECNKIGKTFAKKEGEVDYDDEEYYIDCAIAKIDTDVKFNNRIRPVPKIDETVAVPTEIAGVTQAVLNTQVLKVGARSNLTIGKVIDVKFPFEDVNQFLEKVVRKNQILIKPTSEYIVPDSGLIFPFPGYTNPEIGIDMFVDRGDSGSVLIDDQNQVVGLIWALELTDESLHTGGGIACHIRPVLKELNITINTTTTTVNPGMMMSSALNDGATPAIGIVEEMSRSTPGLHYIENELNQSPTGREIIDLIKKYLPEVMSLIDYCRPVTVVWHRKQGPAFLASFMNSVQAPDQNIPKEVNGVPLQTFLTNLAVVLEERGSVQLSQAIRDNALTVFNYANQCDTIEMFLQKVKRS